MNTDIEETVTDCKNCTKCADFQRRQPYEPLRPTETPGLPFMMVEFESLSLILLADSRLLLEVY